MVCMFIYRIFNIFNQRKHIYHILYHISCIARNELLTRQSLTSCVTYYQLLYAVNRIVRYRLYTPSYFSPQTLLKFANSSARLQIVSRILLYYMLFVFVSYFLFYTVKLKTNSCPRNVTQFNNTQTTIYRNMYELVAFQYPMRVILFLRVPNTGIRSIFVQVNGVNVRPVTHVAV